MTFPNVAYTSGANWNTATPISAPKFSCPFDGINIPYLLEQDFMCNFGDFAPLDLSTPHPEFDTYFLVKESERIPIGGKVKWTRVYARVPDQYTEPAGSTTYDFVGFWGTFGFNIDAISGRPVTTRTVPMFVSHVWYLCDIAQAYATPDAIPLPEPTRYYSQTGSGLDVRMLCDSPFTPVSDPTRADYEDLIAADAADPTSYSIIVESRAPVREWGNIFRVDTFMIKAQ